MSRWTRLTPNSDVLFLLVSTIVGIASWRLTGGLQLAAAMSAIVLAAAVLLARLGLRHLDEYEPRQSSHTAIQDAFAEGRAFDVEPWWALSASRRKRYREELLRLYREQHELLQWQQQTAKELQKVALVLYEEVSNLHAELEETRRAAVRSNRINFWVGVAISIPIGVLINLATG